MKMGWDTCGALFNIHSNERNFTSQKWKDKPRCTGYTSFRESRFVDFCLPKMVLNNQFSIVLTKKNSIIIWMKATG